MILHVVRTKAYTDFCLFLFDEQAENILIKQ